MTCPKPIVSRTGSRANTTGTAAAQANQRGQPWRRATGSTSHQVPATTTSEHATVCRTATVCIDSTVIGVISSAANGGYVKPYGLSFHR